MHLQSDNKAQIIRGKFESSLIFTWKIIYVDNRGVFRKILTIFYDIHLFVPNLLIACHMKGRL